MIRLFTTIAVLGIFGSGCVPANLPPAQAPAPSRAKADQAVLFIRAAQVMSRQGKHHEASYYLEAALEDSGDESQVLPLLVSAQIRANRLRAAQKSLTRLKILVPEHPAIDALIALVSRLTTTGCVEPAGIVAGRSDALAEVQR